MNQEELMDDGEYANDEAQDAAEAAVPEIDFDRVSLLLGIIRDVANTGPMNAYISGEAGEELKRINEACRNRGLARADAIRRQEAEAAQARAQELKAYEDGPKAIPNPDAPESDPAPTIVDRRGA